MRDERMLADKAHGFTHDHIGSRCLAHHGIGDAGQRLNLRRNTHPGIHQALKTINNLAVIDHDDGNFCRALTLIRGKPRGFKVDNGLNRHKCLSSEGFVKLFYRH